MLTMKNERLQMRISLKEKKEVIKLAKEKGFKNLTAFIYWLIIQAKKGLIILCFLFLLEGCATVSYLPSNSSRILLPTQTIEIFFEKPQKPYIVLGKVISQSLWSSNMPSRNLLDKLKQKAMQVGADAIIIENVTPHKTISGALFFISTWTTQKIEGLAIKWKE